MKKLESVYWVVGRCKEGKMNGREECKGELTDKSATGGELGDRKGVRSRERREVTTKVRLG